LVWLTTPVAAVKLAGRLRPFHDAPTVGYALFWLNAGESLLATTVGRTRWAAGHLVISACGTVVLLTVLGLAAGPAHGLRAHDVGGQLPRLLGAALVQLPAAWVPAAIVVVLFGFVPRSALAAWGVLGACLLLGQLGPALKLGQGRWICPRSAMCRRSPAVT
jgi:putative exporter of polyketide antibiotics